MSAPRPARAVAMSAPRTPIRALALFAGFALACLLLAYGPMTSIAHADPMASDYTATAQVAADGSVTVSEKITFSAAPAELVQNLEQTEALLGDRRYEFSYDQITAKTASGKDLSPAISSGGGLTTIKVSLAGVTEPIVISYRVRGAAVVGDAGTTTVRLLLLQGLSVPVDSFTGTVEAPGQFVDLSCVAGPPGTERKCAAASGGAEGSAVPTFSDGPRGIGEIVGARVTYPDTAVASNQQLTYRWTLSRAFHPGLAQLIGALALLVVGGLVVFWLYRRSGIDARGGEITRVAEFAPVGEGTSEFRALDDIHPGHVGTLVDERVDPIDVTATLIDLAVRGHLLITELPTGEFARGDWNLVRLESSDAVRPFEAELLTAIAPVGGEAKLSELAGRIAEQVPAIQSALYDEVVERGWFDHRPDRVRNTWTQIGVIVLVAAVVLTVVLAAFTTFGLIGIAAVLVALGFLYVAQEMPSRTKAGVAVLHGLDALRGELYSAPTDRMPKGRELEELSEVLPYAVVLGGSERWLDAIVAADDDPDPDPTDLTWYHGPDNWHLRDLPDSLRNFITTASGLLFTR